MLEGAEFRRLGRWYGDAMAMVLEPVLPLWLDPLFLIAVSSLCTGVLTLPLAIKLER